MNPSRTGAAAATDLIALLAFVVIGRGSHGEQSALAGIATTAWPFLTGAAVGWVAVLVLMRSRPGLQAASPLAGAAVLAGTVVVGMALRHLSGGGTPVSFLVAGTVFLTLFLLGWRLLAQVMERRRRTAA